jgi:hypothetical protein
MPAECHTVVTSPPHSRSMQSASMLRRALVALLVLGPRSEAQGVIQFIFTSDQHYGISRAAFRGDSNVNAAVVNAALVRQMNSMPKLVLPVDGGVHAGQAVGPVDFVAFGGDIANRAEKGAQPAAVSWREFEKDYMHGLALRAHDGSAARLFVVPGNHDFSNAIGFPKPLTPAHDATSLAGIYNLMMGREVTAAALDPRRDIMNTSRTMGGIHFVFLTIWPDSVERIWLKRDLDTVAASTPVMLFAHDPPIGDPKHFTNPNGTHDMTEADGFENLLRETYKDAMHLGGGRTSGALKASTDIEQRQLVAFVKGHANIKAYFHGHSNANEFYVWHGPDNDVSLNTFRVDSPMKGAVSATDETRLSFQLVTIDVKQMRMTVRECLWNSSRNAPVTFGESKTVSLR